MRGGWKAWETPRTDAFCMKDCGGQPKDKKPHEWAAFARKLERELIRRTHPQLVRSTKGFDFDKALRDVCATEEYLNDAG